MVFEDRGLAEATMQEIGKQAGLSSGTVYRYFSDKADVFAYLLRELEEDLRSETTLPIDDDGKLIVGPAVLRYLQLYREHASLYRVWWESLQPPTEFSEAWVAMHEAHKRGFAAALHRGESEGATVSGLDVDLASELAVLLFERPIFTRLILDWDPDSDDEDIAGIIQAMLGSGLGSKAPAR